MEREVPERLGGRALIAPCEERCLIKFNADQPASALEGEKARVRAGVGVQNQPAPAAPREVTHGNRANAACKRTTWVELEYGVRETESVPGGHAGEAKQRVRRPRDVSPLATKWNTVVRFAATSNVGEGSVGLRRWRSVDTSRQPKTASTKVNPP